MSAYTCEICNYTTDKQHNYTRHINSSKHLEKINATEKHICKYCKKTFGSRQSKWTHEKKSCIKRLDPIQPNVQEVPLDGNIVNSLLEQIKSKENMLMERDKRLENLLLEQSKERKEYMDVIKNTTKTTRKSVSAMKYVVLNYGKAPPIEKLNDKKAIKLLEYDGPIKMSAEEMMIHKFRYDLLHEYLGMIIIDEYKNSENPEYQSLWSSDITRLSFVIVQKISKEKNEWISDKSGVKIMDLIITPLLSNAKKILNEYTKKCAEMNIKINKKLNKGKQLKYKYMSNVSNASDYSSNSSSSSSDSSDDSVDSCMNQLKCETNVKNMQTAYEIRLSIDSKELHKNVLRYICPYFKINIPE